MVAGLHRMLSAVDDILRQWDVPGTPPEAVFGKQLREKSCVLSKIHRLQHEIHHCIGGSVMVQGICSN